MDSEKLYEERSKRIEITQRGGQADRVPVYSLIDNWAFSYAGYSIEEIFADDEKHYKAFERVVSDFYWDAMFTSCTSKAMNYVNALGGGSYTTSVLMQVETGKANSMDPSEYEQFTKDPAAFIRDVIAPRKYELMAMPYSEEKYQKYVKALDYFGRFRTLGGMSVKRFREEHGMPITRGAVWWHPVDLFLDFIRDFEGTITDIKRNPNKFKDACEALYPLTLDITFAGYPQHVEGKCVFNPMHTPQFLSRRDFEKVYLPIYKDFAKKIEEKGMILQSYYERNYEHLHDYLKDLPKNLVFGLFEDDDMRLVKKNLGDMMCIAGGMDTYVLNYGTKQECIDMAKSLIDDLAPGGGYIFTTNRIPHSPNDGKAENVKAVNDFVREYGVYK